MTLSFAPFHSVLLDELLKFGAVLFSKSVKASVPTAESHGIFSHFASVVLTLVSFTLGCLHFPESVFELLDKHCKLAVLQVDASSLQE